MLAVTDIEGVTKVMINRYKHGKRTTHLQCCILCEYTCEKSSFKLQLFKLWIQKLVFYRSM